MKLIFNKQIIPWAIIIILAIVIFFLRSCKTKCTECPKSDTITIIKHDTVLHITYINKPYPDSIITPPDTFTVVDSAKCLQLERAYFTKNIYNDTLQNDSNALVALLDTVYRNQLQNRRLLFRNRKATLIQNITTVVGDTTKKRNKVFVGLTVGRSLTQFTFGPSLMFQDKKDHTYSLTYDPFFKDFYGTVYFKIKLHK